MKSPIVLGFKVLMIEDSPEDRAHYRESLSRFPDRRYEFLEADTCRSGLELLRIHRPDVLILDYRLPDCDGLVALDRLRSEGAGELPCAVVMVTAHGAERVAVEALQKGALDYLVKGAMSEASLHRAVHGAAERFRLARELKERTAELEIKKLQIEEQHRELEEALRSRDEFISVASHELRNPLTSIQLHLQYVAQRLQSTRESDKPEALLRVAQDGAGKALTGVQRVISLVDKLLDIDRIRNRGLGLQRASTELHSLVQDSVTQFAAMAHEAGSPIGLVRVEPLIGSYDPARIGQVITNLISNALKYGSGRPIEIALYKQQEEAVLNVSDQGIGIPNEALYRIFDRYERAVSSTQGYHGTGLGLYVARMIVQAHGGSISVRSEPGQGSTFTVRLPLDG